MRITFVNPTVGTLTGGVETTIRELAPILAERHDVALLTGRSPHRVDIPFPDGGAMRVVRIPYLPRFSPPNRVMCALLRLDPYRVEALSFFLSFLLSAEARRLVRESDVLSTHYRVDSQLFSSWAARKGVASVFHVQGVSLGGWFKRLDRSARYVAVGERDGRELTRRTGVRMHATVTPGIPEQWLSLPRAEEDLLLFVGRLQPSKRPEWALQVFRGLMDDFPALTLEIVGVGPSTPTLETLVGAPDLHGRVTLVGDVPHDALGPYYRRAKVLLFPTAAEVFGLVALEAMAAGCPVVASDLPVLRESVAPATFAPLDEEAGWVEATRRLLGSPDLRKEAEQEGRAWAVNHTWRRTAEAYEKQLRLAVEGHRAAIRDG